MGVGLLLFILLVLEFSTLPPRDLYLQRREALRSDRLRFLPSHISGIRLWAEGSSSEPHSSDLQDGVTRVPRQGPMCHRAGLAYLCPHPACG